MMALTTSTLQANGQIYQAQIVPVTGPLTTVATTEVSFRNNPTHFVKTGVPRLKAADSLS